MMSVWPFTFLLVILYLQKGTCVPLKILGVLPFPGRSHFVMTGRLMKELALRGHQVDVVSMFPLKKPIANYRDTIVKSDDTLMPVSNVSYQQIQRFGQLSMSYFVQQAGIKMCDVLSHPKMQALLATEKGTYDVIIVENILGIFPSGAKSHFVMTGKLMRELALRGHQVDVVGMFPMKEPIPNYRDIVLKTNNVIVFVNNVTYADLQQDFGFNQREFVRTIGIEPCDSLSLPNMRQLLKTEKGFYDVIIVELFLAHCYLALGQHLDAPIVGIVTSKLPDWLLGPFGNHLNPSYMPSLFSSASQHMKFWERLQNTFMTNVITPQINYFMEAEVEQVERYFGRKLTSMNDLYKDVSLILVNEHHSLNDIKPMTPDVIAVGGLHVVDDDQQLTADLAKWLDESTEGCVYFTFGSMVKIETFPEATVKIFYEMFERIAPVRVLIKIVDPGALPAGLPKNVKTALWLPQVAILKHKNVKLFITHGGLMGTQEAIAHRVPMVGLPLFGDQHTNIQSYANKKIAIALDLRTITADSLTNAVKTVLNDPIYRNNIEKMSKLFFDRPMSAIDTAVYWVEYAAKHGAVLKSPATELAWWQFYLLDVYGFILMCILVSLCIIKKLITVLWKSICPRKDSKNFSEDVLKYKKTK